MESNVNHGGDHQYRSDNILQSKKEKVWRIQNQG